MSITAKVIASNRKEAVRLGIKRYHSKCKHHGDVIRWTSNGVCIECCRPYRLAYIRKNKDQLRKKRNDWDKTNPEKAMLQRVRGRSKAMGLPFDLTVSDIEIPEFCPVLGIRLERGIKCNQDSSPSIDRLVPTKGYVKGNIKVISNLANRIKADATSDQIKKVLEYCIEHHC